jgi:autotransporter-associated beta strand protein
MILVALKSPRTLLAAGLLFCAAQAQALNDNLTLTVTNTWTKQPVTFNLQRYNLRGTNYQVRVYSDATTYTLLPTNQIPEVTTYRGRITGDPGAVVIGAFKSNGDFYYSVSYGCRWQASTSEYDPYDTTNRLSWGAWSTTVATPNVPSLGYVTNYPVAATNLPQHITWSTNNYPAAAAVSYGGPPYLNNLKQVPTQRVRLVLDSDLYRLFSQKAGSNIVDAILIQESRVNDVDYEQARDLGVCYQIACVCVRTNTQLPYTTTTGNLSEENSFWNPDPGYSHGVGTNGWFDMVHGSVNVATAAGWAYAPGDFSVMDPDWCGFASGHEMGHNWGQSHYSSTRDYTGDNFWHVAMDGSGYGYATVDANLAQSLRRTSWKGGIEFVKYNYQLPPHATPDLAVTKTNQAISLNVLLNDYIANSNTLSIVSHETNTLRGGAVTNLGGGVLRYTPAAGFAGYDLFHYYVGEPSGLKSLTAAKVLVASDSNPLLGEWLFNETSGTTAAEFTGNGQGATLFGTANFASGSVPGVGGGTALHFDGAGYARIQGTWFDSFNTNTSISLWCKPDATPGGEQMLLMKSSLDSGGSPGIRLGMNATSFFFSGATVGGQSSFNVSARLVPQAGVWYHVVGEIDRTSGLIRLYVNGLEYTSTSGTRSIPAGEFIAADNWPVLGMANDGAGSKSWFAGTIDDLRFYTKALTAAEVTALYQGSGLLPAGGPHPYDGEINVAMQPAMSWQAGNTNNFQYNVYLGTNAASLAAATTNSLEYQGRTISASFTPAAPLAASTLYYWRVDEVYGTNLVPGPVWSFATAADALHGGLKLYLSLDSRDTVGTATYDRSGAPFHDGTLYNSPATTSGEVYEGLAFNGSTSYVETPALNLNTTNVTLLAWINNAGAQSSYAGLIFCRGTTTTAGLDFRGTSGQLGYHWNNEAGTYNYVSSLSPPVNQWSLAALTVQNNRAILYLGTTDGVLQMATNNYTHVLQAFDGAEDIARDSTGGRNFNGAMDEVCIWNRTLSAAEIGQILTNGINGASFGGPRPTPNPATFTWTGNSDAYWTNSLNWATNGTPGAGNTVYFNDCANGNTGTQIGTNLSVAGINVSGGIRGIGIFGTSNTLTLGSGGIQLSNTAANLTLGAAVSLAAVQAWTVPDGSTLTLTNKLSGTGNPTITKNGDGALYLNNNNAHASYGGAVVINGGSVSLPAGWGNPSLTGNVSVGTNGTLIFNSHPYSYSADNYTTNAGTLIVNGDNHCSNLELRGGQISGTGGLRVGDYWGYSTGGKWASRASSVTATINIGYLSLYNVNTTFTVENGTADPDLLVSAPLKDGANGPASFTKTGAGSLMLTQPSTYTGNTTNSQGTLSLSGPDNILPVTTSLYLASGTTLNLNGINQTVASLTGFGGVSLAAGSFTITEAGTNTFNGVFSGNPSGVVATDYQTAPPGGIAMAGTGKLTLSAAQTYTGDTWISAGRLALSGAGAVATSSNLVVASGATLDASGRSDSTLRLAAGQTLSGFGAVAGRVTFTNGAVIAPGGNAMGTLTLNNILDLTGGQAQMRINKTGGILANDAVTGVTTLTCAGTLAVTNTGTDPLAPGDSFKLFNATSYAGAFVSFILPPLATNLVWDTSKLAVNGTLSVAAPVVLVPPTLSGVVSAGAGGVQITFSGTNGQTYKVLSSTNVSLPITNWIVLTNGTFGAGPATFTDGAATNPAGFYRIVSP